MRIWFSEAERRCVCRQRFAGHRRGAVMLEFAFVLPLFLMLVLGIIEVGRLLMVTQLVTEASRAACRLAVLSGATAADVTNEATESLQAGGISSSVVVGVTITGQTTVGGPVDQPINLATIPEGYAVSVKVDVPFATVAWITPTFFRAPKVSVATVMRKESH
ncbi:MAG: pilus assembly protein [Planctomycetota bacterium]|nr:pilus assembly protein [Planctomycetota bacterium]